jgi:hypothetical protein
MGLALLGLGSWEYRERQTLQLRYQEALESRRQLALRYGEMLATHEQLKVDLAEERQRAQGLEQRLASTRTELDQVGQQLAQATRNVRGLELRLASATQQVDQLQGELVVALDESKPAPAAGPVELERIVVAQPGAADLQGRVISVHKDWNFVVIDLGWNNVHIGDVVTIVRQDQLLAKARVERVQESVCAASLLPDWATAEVRINDIVKAL